MMCCAKHWGEPRAAIRERGLEKYVAQGGADAMRRIQTGEYEPLLMANGALVAAACIQVGRHLLSTNACPVCKIDDTGAIASAADGALNEARKRGLLGSC